MKRVIIFAILMLLFCAKGFAQEDRGKKGGKGERQTQLLARDEAMKAKLIVGSELLGCPTDNSVIVNVVFSVQTEAFFEYGSNVDKAAKKTKVTNAKPNAPVVALLDGLNPDTKYYYKLNYRTDGKDFIKGEEHSFWTRKTPGSVYTFVIEADPHLDENSDPELYRAVLKSMAADKPDFMIDLGDTFMSDKFDEKSYAVIEDRALLFRDFWGTVCGNSPLFMVLGNHEGETGWPDKGAGRNLTAWAEKARMMYYPVPVSDKTYTANTEKKGDYYSFSWGDVLFVMLDNYRYTMNKPRPGTDSGWEWTLGKAQYQWLKDTLSHSKERYKFVFAHQLVGGGDQGRGGAEFADFFEWGGKSPDGKDVFASKRQGWEKPIAKLLTDNGVQVFFHGHDHLFAKQDKNGLIYQEVPQPSARNTNDPDYPQEYGYQQGIVMGNTGYLRVNVGPGEVKVTYIRFNGKKKAGVFVPGDEAFSYSITSDR